MEKPENGWATEVEVVEIIDGDTVKVRLTREFNVRLQDDDKDFNVAEKNTKEGQDAARFLDDIFETSMFEAHYGKDFEEETNEPITLFIPANKAINLMDINSFNRIKGKMWIGDKNITDLLKKEGFEK